ncbi:MAG: hypothetical protein ACK2UV_10525, partial [Candidatus Promineifilaceae bacterium]
MKRKETVIAVLVAALFVLAIGAVWVAAQVNGVVYYACVNNSSGTIHMIGSEDECNSNEIR